MPIFTPMSEDLTAVKGCTVHKGRRGHLIISPDQNAYMIPYCFALGDELRYSDAATLNAAIYSGSETAGAVMNYCFDWIKGKNGILRKHCYSTRPTNCIILVASPSDKEWGTIYLPERVFEMGKFLFLTEDGIYNSCKIE
ncbi:hypothetical protein LTR95_014652 [Oleoguttula sp. CCFEE 5521]